MLYFIDSTVKLPVTVAVALPVRTNRSDALAQSMVSVRSVELEAAKMAPARSMSSSATGTYQTSSTG
jgi:predicted outer membrane protein